jgi:hypothetical protein
MLYFGVAVIAIMVGMLIGAGIVSYLLRCNHVWEKIIDDQNSCHHTTVHMCTKCGKKVITQVDLYE